MNRLGLEIATILDGVPSGIAVLRDRRYVWVNPAMSELSGYPASELVGQVTRVMYDSAEEYERVGLEVANAFSMGKAYETDLSIRRKDGATCWVTVKGRLINPADPAAGSVWFMQDITGHKLSEVSLRLHELMTHNMQEGLLLVRDGDGTIVYANPRGSSMFGYARGELNGKHVSCINAPTDDSPEETAGNILDALQRSGTWSGEIKNVRKDGTALWCKATVSGFDHPDHGKVWLSIHTDITALKMLETVQDEHLRRIRELGQRLVAVQEEERRKLGAELHDRTSANLAAMTLLLKDFAENLPGPDGNSLNRKLEDIRALMDDTIRTIRDISVDMRPPLLDFFGLDAALEDLAEKISRRTGIPILVSSSGSRRPDIAAQTVLYRIATEALANCIKHARATAIDIHLAATDGRIVLTVADNGAGFVPDAPKSPMGLGLATMRERTEFAGGSFRVESAPGYGTTICVELPCMLASTGMLQGAECP